MHKASMRLLHVIHDLNPDGGGPPEYLLQVAQGHQAAGVTIEVLTLDDPEAPYLDRYPFPVHALGPTSSTFGYSSAARRWLREHASEFDAILVDGLWNYLGIAARSSARAAHIPYLVFPHGMLDPWFREQYPFKHIKKQLFWWVGQYQVLRDADLVVFTTEEEQRLALGSFRPNAWRSAIVPLGTSGPTGDAAAQREAFFVQCPAVRERRFLLFLGRIHEKKGCDLLLKAFGRIAAEYPDVDLVLAGPDQTGLRAKLEALAVESGLSDRVHWPGMLQGDAKWGAFLAAEAFVLPSHQENFGIAIAEAISCGVPVLISNKINIWNYIVEDGTGFVEDDTEEGTLRLLRAWLEASREQRGAMVDRTEASFERRFSMRTCAARILDLIEGLSEKEHPLPGSTGVSEKTPAAR